MLLNQASPNRFDSGKSRKHEKNSSIAHMDIKMNVDPMLKYHCTIIPVTSAEVSRRNGSFFPGIRV
jgi:hypothetical protein